MNGQNVQVGHETDHLLAVGDPPQRRSLVDSRAQFGALGVLVLVDRCDDETRCHGVHPDLRRELSGCGPREPLEPRLGSDVGRQITPGEVGALGRESERDGLSDTAGPTHDDGSPIRNRDGLVLVVVSRGLDRRDTLKKRTLYAQSTTPTPGARRLPQPGRW